MPGGPNLKALAIQKLKKDLAFRTNIEGKSIPVNAFDVWCAAANSLVSIRIAGVATLRFLSKHVALARSYWMTPRQQESLNVISDRLMLAEQRCSDRAAKRAENRLLRDVLAPLTEPTTQKEIEAAKRRAAWRPGDPGRPPCGVDRTPKPVPPKPTAPTKDSWDELL